MIKNKEFAAALDVWAKENIAEKYVKQFKDIAARSFDSAAKSERQLAAKLEIIENSYSQECLDEYMATFHRHVLRVMRKHV